MNFSKNVAKLHKYWARKPSEPVNELLGRYSSIGDLVLDPFCGSGSIGTECVLNGRNYQGLDLNPIAVQISQLSTTLFADIEEIEAAFRSVDVLVGDEIMSWYREESEFLMYQVVQEDGDVETMLCDRAFSNKRKQIRRVSAPRASIPKIDSTFGKTLFPQKFYKDRFSKKGLRDISDFFTPRNLAAIDLISKAISEVEGPSKPYLQIALSNSLLHLSKLKSKNIRPLSVNNFWLPREPVEENAWWRFSERLLGVIDAVKAINNRAINSAVVGSSEILLKSALDLRHLEANSVDYIFTDPPYGDVIQYSELSFIWNSFINESYAITEEVIVNPVQDKGEDYFLNQLDTFFVEAYRVLKVEHFFTLCFHNKIPQIWVSAAKSLYSAGFQLEDIDIFPFHGSTYNKSWAKFSPKSDVYLTLKKASFHKNSATAHLPVSEIFDEIKKMKLTDPNAIYDTFVELVLRAIFSGREIELSKSLTIEKIISNVLS